MTQVMPLQQVKVDNLQNLSMFLDAIQNPVKYISMIDDAQKVLEKLKLVLEKTSTVENAENHLELAKQDRIAAQYKFDDLKEDFDVDMKAKKLLIEKDQQEVKKAFDKIQTDKSDIEKRLRELEDKERKLEKQSANIASEQANLKLKEISLVQREQELKKRTEAMKQLVS